MIGGVRQIKASVIRGGGHALRFKGDVLYRGADTLDSIADQVDPRGPRVSVAFWSLDLL